MKCYLDLDGTIADFVKHLLRALDMRNPYYGSNLGNYNLPEILGTTREDCFRPCASPKFWSSIPFTPDAYNIINAVSEFYKPEDIIILTRPTEHPGAVSGKIEWIQSKLGASMTYIITTRSKGEFAKYAEPGSLLIDDCDEYVDEWRKSGNPAILVPRLWNTRHKEAEVTTDWNKEIREAISAHTSNKQVTNVEIRMVDPKTGGQKGSKLADFSMLPPSTMWELAEHYGKGATKYSPNNWCKGYKWSYSYSALQRHLHQFWMGEDIDAETGSKHMIAAAWHCLALAWFMDNRKDHDDRPILSKMEKEWANQK